MASAGLPASDVLRPTPNNRATRRLAIAERIEVRAEFGRSHG